MLYGMLICIFACLICIIRAVGRPSACYGWLWMAIIVLHAFGTAIIGWLSNHSMCMLSNAIDMLLEGFQFGKGEPKL